ncbi:MAG: ATP-dependent Clp protease ATP-binding subunit, partial [Bacteroidota bacterium]
YKSMKSNIEDALKRVFNPEFLNRVDDTLVFHNLEREHILQIIDITAKELLVRMNSMGITVEIAKPAKEFLADKGFDPSFGARPLKRAVQKYVEDPLAEEILKGTFQTGGKIKVKYDKKKEDLTFVDTSKDSGGDELKELDEEIADLPKN